MEKPVVVVRSVEIQYLTLNTKSRVSWKSVFISLWFLEV